METDLVEDVSKLLPAYAISMLIGKLLGDGNLTIEKNKRPRLRFSHKLQDKQWCAHSRDLLAAHISFPTIKYRKVKDARITNGFTESYYAQSHTHPALELLKQLWYPSGVKIIPFHLLQTHFTRTSLAWWFMDDGHLKIVNGQPSKIILSTESFTPLELKRLCSILNEKFLLEFKIDKAKRLVIYNKMQIHYFLKLVQPYLVSCMYRKTLLKSSLSNVMTPKRTTIYLPIKLTSPTKEIQEALLSLRLKIELLSDETKYIGLYCRVLKNLDMKKQINYSYQVILQPHQIVEISKCQAVTGMRVSEIVHWCFLK
ncbi:endonuclease [Fictibacillus nanhaiensis]|uniref:endonuclease n=1 Tax=Fictibacillus nanhaiensis TaxID=742169 RepID=UPI002E1DE60F|nr:endonuclease [Fictibacillus nanhaiensis]